MPWHLGQVKLGRPPPGALRGKGRRLLCHGGLTSDAGLEQRLRDVVIVRLGAAQRIAGGRHYTNRGHGSPTGGTAGPPASGSRSGRRPILPWTKVPAHTATQTGHGRRTTRTIKIIDAPAWVGFTGAAQVAQVRRTTTRAGKKTVEVVYLITSADHHAAPPVILAGWIQGHWAIENQLHWVRDVSYDEDRSQIRTGNAPQLMATLRNTAISLLRLTGWTNIAAGLRHHARTSEHTLKTLLTW